MYSRRLPQRDTAVSSQQFSRSARIVRLAHELRGDKTAPFGEHLEEIHEIVETADVCQLMRHDRLDLQRRKSGQCGDGQQHDRTDAAQMTAGTCRAVEWQKRIARSMPI